MERNRVEKRERKTVESDRKGKEGDSTQGK
jgi:hypothetical protein